MRNLLRGLLAATALAVVPAAAQVQQSGYRLPLSLAIEAAQEAIRACEASGYRVSASVVDTSGVVLVQARGDHSTIHTEHSSFRKAYTVVTLGPIFRFQTSSAFAALVAGSPNGPGLITLPHVIPLAGAVAIRRGEEVVAAIGVGGAPGGERDEVCAQAGVALIQARVNR